MKDLKVNIKRVNDEEVQDVIYRFIENIAKTRDQKGLVQDVIEEITGIKQQAVSRIENHKHLPSLTTTIKLLMGLEIDINSLFEAGGEKKDE